MPIYPETVYILTLDIGSSSTRAMLFDTNARAVEGMVAQERYELHTAGDGTSELAPDLLFSHVERAIDALLERAGSYATQIGAVAVDTFVSNLMGVDEQGNPVTPLFTYADTRNSVDALTLRSRLDEREVQQRTGGLLRTSYGAARLAWVRRTQPEIWRKVARWMTFGEYLESRLFGKCRVTFSAASWSGLLNRHELIWDEPLLREVGVSGDQFSPLVDHHEYLHGLVSDYATRWNPLSEIPWFPAIGDGAAANVGSGCTYHDRMALTIGTSGAIRVIQKNVKEVPAGLWCYRVNLEYSLVGGATSEGGNVYAWLRQTLKLDDPATVETALAELPPDGHGLTILPFVAGERSPGWAGNIPATIHGITLATTPIQIVQASLEAIAYRCALIEQRLCEDRFCHHWLIASGGALLSSPWWMQTMADVMGHSVVASGEVEATSRGTALLALKALGILPSLEAISAQDGMIYEPNKERHEIYQAAMARQQELYGRLVDFT
jgi:gluconokinase